MKISTVIITHNEAKNIGRCINSVIPVSDEIIVVDSFSTDETVDICKKMGAIVFQHEWCGYIEQKNWANQHASHEYILSIDADEVLSDSLIASIKNIKNNPDADAYTFNRLTNYCGKWIKHGSWYPDKKLRLWKKSKGKWQGKLIHEFVELEKNAIVKHLKGDLLHYSYYSISQHIEQANHFTNITAQEALEKGKKSNIFKVCFNPIWKFKRDYFFKLGFLDGYYGFVVCVISAFATFLKYAKLLQIIRNTRNENK